MARATFQGRQAIAPVRVSVVRANFKNFFTEKSHVYCQPLLSLNLLLLFFSFPIKFATVKLLHVSCTLSCMCVHNADSHKLVRKICAHVCTSNSTTYHFRDCKMCERQFCVQLRFLFQVVPPTYHSIDNKHDERVLEGFTSHRQSPV
jgi:hypothetical protein